jgi:hypothetical protein
MECKQKKIVAFVYSSIVSVGGTIAPVNMLPPNMDYDVLCGMLGLIYG